jgi:iron(III) transport system substrate-binding protein
VTTVRRFRSAGCLAVLVALASVAAACGGDNKSSAGAATTAAAAGTVAKAPAPTSGATTTAAPNSAAWDAVVANAKQEGKVTIYSSQGLDVLNDLAAKFKEKYGITLEVVRGIDADLIPKVDAEVKTGNRVADVVAFANAQWGVDGATKGLFVAPTGPAFDDAAYN